MRESEQFSDPDLPSGPVRRPNKGQRGLQGRLSSTKNPYANEHESSLERDLLILLEFDPNIQRYQVQPVRIPYHDLQGAEHSYTPDVFIEYRRDIVPARWLKHRLCEVKFRDDIKANWKLYRSKFRAAVAHARVRGWRFEILTEKEIRTPYLDNARFLRGYMRGVLTETDDAWASHMLRTLFEMRTTTPQELLGALAQCSENRAQIIPVLWRLIAARSIGVDLGRPLTMQSPLWSVSPDQELPHRLERKTAWT